MEIQLKKDADGVLRARLSGQVARIGIDSDPAALEQALGDDIYQRRVLLDMSATSFLDSSGIGWLLKCHRRFNDRQGKLVLHSVTEQVGRVLTMLRLENALNLAENEHDAELLLSVSPGEDS